MFYSCTHMATVGVKGLSYNNVSTELNALRMIVSEETAGMADQQLLWLRQTSLKQCAEDHTGL